MEHHDEILAELAKLGETRTWEPGTAVVSEGEVADCMYIVHAGELRAVIAGVGRIGNLLRQKNLWASFGSGSLPST